MRHKYFILIQIIFLFGSVFSQSKDSIDTFRKNKILFSFIYNHQLSDKYEYFDDSKKNLHYADSIKTRMLLSPNFGFRFNYALCLAQRNSFYHFFRLNFYFHKQLIELYDTVYYKQYYYTGNNYYYNNVKKGNKYYIDMLNLAILPEYVLMYKLNSNLGFQFGFGYNYSYTIHYNYEFYKLLLPFLINRNYFINNYQLNLSAVRKISKQTLLEFGLYWNTNPLWNKYMGIMAGVSF